MSGEGVPGVWDFDGDKTAIFGVPRTRLAEGMSLARPNHRHSFRVLFLARAEGAVFGRYGCSIWRCRPSCQCH